MKGLRFGDGGLRIQESSKEFTTCQAWQHDPASHVHIKVAALLSWRPRFRTAQRPWGLIKEYS